MTFDIVGNPDFGDLVVTLAPGEAILAESGAMSRMSARLHVRSHLMGGFLKAIIRKLVGGESLFVGEYSAVEAGGFVSFAPAVPGSVLHRKLAGESFVLTAES